MLYQEELETLEKIAELKQSNELHANTILSLLRLERSIGQKIEKECVEEYENTNLESVTIPKLLKEKKINVREHNCLMRADIKNSKQVEEHLDDIKHCRVRNLGKQSANNIEELLEEYKKKSYR